jgi:hypothetical protein
VAVSVLVDLTSYHAGDPPGELSSGIPDTWEIVAPRSHRCPDRAQVRLKSIARWPARGDLLDRTLAAAQADGRYLAFVPRLDAEEIAWIADAFAALDSRPDTAVIRRDDADNPALDPATAFVIRRDVWIALRGYVSGPSMASPRCGDLDVFQRVRGLGYRDEVTPGGQPDRTHIPPGRHVENGEIVVFTAITNGYDHLLPLEPRCVRPARQVAFLDESSRAVAHAAANWEIREIDWHDEDPNRVAKLPKIRPAPFFPEAEYSLWVDGNVVLTYPFDIHRLVELYLQDADVCVFPHHARSCVYQEAEACKVRRLDSPDVIDRQMARYREEGFPERFGMQELVVILRRHSDAVDDFGRQWWDEIVRGSRRDQLSFQYVRWKTGLPVAEFPLPIQRRNGLFAKVPHRERRPFRFPTTQDARARIRRMEGFYFGSKRTPR